MLRAAIAAVLLLGAGTVSADSVFELREVDGRPVCVETDAGVSASALQPVPTHLLDPHVNANGMTIQLLGTDQLEKFPAAKAAFERAAKTWERYITNPITVVVKVDFGPETFGVPFNNKTTLGQTIVDEYRARASIFLPALKASAAPGLESELVATLPTSGIPTVNGMFTYITGSRGAMMALGVLPVPPDVPILGRIGFNSNFNFDFDRSDGTSGYDFESTALHEIGHALGFTSTVGTGVYFISALDVFRVRPGAQLASFATDPRIQTADGDQVLFAGVTELPLSTGGDGYQPGHWKNSRSLGFSLGVMNPFIEGFIGPSKWDLLALDLIGYTVAYPAPPAAPSNLRAEAVSATAVLLTWNDNSDNESEFRLAVSVDGAPGSEIEFPSILANETSFTITPMTSNIKYHFALRAMNAGGWSDYSNVATATTAPPYGLPRRRAAAR